RLKRVERNAHEEQHAQGRQVPGQPHRRQRVIDVADEEVEVLEEAEEAEVRRDTQSEECPAMRRARLHAARRAVVDDGGRGDQDQDPGMDVAVERIAASEQQDVLRTLRQLPIDDREGDEKNYEVEA